MVVLRFPAYRPPVAALDVLWRMKSSSARVSCLEKSAEDFRTHLDRPCVDVAAAAVCLFGVSVLEQCGPCGVAPRFHQVDDGLRHQIPQRTSRRRSKGRSISVAFVTQQASHSVVWASAPSAISWGRHWLIQLRPRLGFYRSCLPSFLPEQPGGDFGHCVSGFDVAALE